LYNEDVHVVKMFMCWR